MRVARALALLAVIVLLAQASAATNPIKLALAAPAAVEIDDIAISLGVDDEGRPQGERVVFRSGTDQVWISFTFVEHREGQPLSFVLQANGEDYLDGTLSCCAQRRGRFAFAVSGRNGNSLPGAGYRVYIYSRDRELAQTAFAVEGTGGFDNENGNGNDDNSNDNGDDNGNGNDNG
ncbi:MAG: hypothetical protein U0821_26200 [Chloroflexota bacterium]